MLKPLLASLLLVSAVHTSFGQKVIMMGRAWDEEGKPMAGAELKITGRQSNCTVTTDAKGIYATSPVEPGGYKVFITQGDKKWFVAERPKVAKPCQFPEFYNFVVTHDHVELRTDHGRDPEMLERLEKAEQAYTASHTGKGSKQ